MSLISTLASTGVVLGGKNMVNYVTVTSNKNRGIALMLCCLGFLGIGGIHDFYLGKIGRGFVKLLTLNWFMIGTFFDMFRLALGTYTDNTGAPLRK